MIYKLFLLIIISLIMPVWHIDASYQIQPNDQLLKAVGDSRVFIVKDNKKHWIKNPEIFNAYKLNWGSIKETESDELNKYAEISLIQTQDNKIYYIQGNKKRWIKSPEAFNANNFNWSDILQVNQKDAENYTAGEDILNNIFNSVINVEIIPNNQTIQINPVNPNMPEGVDFNVLWNAWKSAEDKFVDKSKIDHQKMLYGAVEGMLKSLKDPYTAFFPPQEYKKFNEDLNGEFGGIGAELGYKKGSIVIITTLKDTPAEKAGLKSGDKIIKINDESALDMTIEDAVARIRGIKGTDVTLIVSRDGLENLVEIKITRDTISLPIVEITKTVGDIAVIKLYSFLGDVDNKFIATVKSAINNGAKKIVLDLRNNPGGFFDSAVNIASEFLPKDKLIVSEDFGNKKELNDSFYSKGGGNFENIPMVILVNGGSASAAEILAGALRDSRDVKLIGEKTFGKGSVQEILYLPNNVSMKVTVAKWFRPSGIPIDEQGIEPDIKIEMTDKDRTEEKDPQLDKAIEMLTNI